MATTDWAVASGVRSGFAGPPGHDSQRESVNVETLGVISEVVPDPVTQVGPDLVDSGAGSKSRHQRSHQTIVLILVDVESANTDEVPLVQELSELAHPDAHRVTHDPIIPEPAAGGQIIGAPELKGDGHSGSVRETPSEFGFAHGQAVHPAGDGSDPGR